MYILLAIYQINLTRIKKKFIFIEECSHAIEICLLKSDCNYLLYLSVRMLCAMYAFQ